MVTKVFFNRIQVWILVAAVILSFSSCGKVNNQSDSINDQNLVAQNIIGGSPSSFVYQKQNGIVALLMVVEDNKGDEAQSICTGSLVSKNIVLTAAHCLAIDPNTRLIAALVIFDTDLKLAIQKISKRDFSSVRKITNVIRHEKYGQGTTSNNDIGLLRFDGAAPNDFKTARLGNLSTAALLKRGQTVTLAGFGVSKYLMNPITGKIDSSGSGLLRQISGVPIIETSPSNEELIFDQKSHKGACHGDSGGPAFVLDKTTGQSFLVGVTSRGTEENGLCDKEVIYTNTIAYSKWISEKLTILSKDQTASK